MATEDTLNVDESINKSLENTLTTAQVYIGNPYDEYISEYLETDKAKDFREFLDTLPEASVYMVYFDLLNILDRYFNEGKLEDKSGKALTLGEVDMATREIRDEWNKEKDQPVKYIPAIDCKVAEPDSLKEEIKTDSVLRMLKHLVFGKKLEGYLRSEAAADLNVFLKKFKPFTQYLFCADVTDILLKKYKIEGVEDIDGMIIKETDITSAVNETKKAWNQVFPDNN